MYQILLLLFFYFLILYSILGYGKILTLINSNYQASSFDGLFGIAFLILISYLTNFFFPHNYLHNSIILIIGLIIFIYDLNKNFLKRILDYRDISIIFSIIFIGILIFKNHDDFYYYHFPYTIILTEFEKIFGLGNLNHGFRTPSSIFYLNSLFYLPIIKYFMINSGAIYILGLSNFILYKLIKSLLDLNKFNHILFLSLLSLIYINSTFARLAEHGTDRSALILIFLMSIFYLKSLDFENSRINLKYFDNYYSKLAILFGIIISLKAFYLIYSVIFIIWFLQIKKFLDIKKFSSLIFKNFYTYFVLTIFVLTIFTMFSNTGCLIYPASFTCFENLSWSIPVDQVNQMKLWYEQWSKAGASPNFRVEDPQTYVSNLNWVNNWIEAYFFNKVSDNILVISFISIFIFFLFFYNSKKKKNTKKNFFLFYFLICLLFIEWFYNHPTLRYGGYTLLALIFFIPVSIFLSGYKLDTELTKKKTYSIFFLIVLIFMTRNIMRIEKEYRQYDYNPFKSAFFYLNKDGFILNDTVKKKFKNTNKKFLVITSK